MITGNNKPKETSIIQGVMKVAPKSDFASLIYGDGLTLEVPIANFPFLENNMRVKINITIALDSGQGRDWTSVQKKQDL